MSFALLGRMLSRGAGVAPPEPNYPLWHAKAGDLARARLGAVLDTGPMSATFLMANAGGMLLTPPEASFIVVGHGKIADAGFMIHRFYSADHMLQVIVGLDGLVCAGEFKLFQKLAEIRPMSLEEWELWTKGTDDVQPMLTGPTVKWQGTEFTRVWSPGNGPADAKQYVEMLDTGAADLSVTSISAMLFGRKLSTGATEWLQLSMCRSGSERWIEAYVGLTVEPGEITAI